MKERQKYKVFHNENTLFFGEQNESESCQAITKKDILKMSGKKLIRTLDEQSLRVITKHPGKVRKAVRDKFRVIRAGGGVVQNLEGKVLFIFRNDHWDLPKGKLESKESIKECAVREVSEECGIPIELLSITGKPVKTQHVFVSGKGNALWKKTNWYPMLLSEDCKLKPQKAEGITELGFFNSNELMAQPDLVTYPLIRNVVRLFD